jgi:membrane protease YdiL (CAAX protease family)
MNQKFNSPDFTIAMLIIGTLVLFYVYHYFAHSLQLRKYFEDRFKNEKEKEIPYFLCKKFSGFLIMGILAGVLYWVFINPSFKNFGLHINNLNANLYTILILIVVIVLITYLNQRSKPEQNLVQMDIKEWDWGLFLLNAFGWAIYLTGYEFLFRGILLFECYNNFGFWPAIAVNVAVYSAIHMVNGRVQAVGALIFGTIACYFALSRGTILIPIFMHVALSVSADYFSIRLNKNLSFIQQAKLKILQK